MLVLPPTVSAQDTPRVELFGGYSYLRTARDFRGVLASHDTGNLNGWEAAVKVNLWSRLGVVADVAGNYGSINGYVPTPDAQAFQRGQVNHRLHTFLFGPEFRVTPDDSRWTVNLRLLGGFMKPNEIRARVALGATGVENARFLVAGSGLQMAAAAGGSLDLRISDRISYRVAQPEVLFIRLGNAFNPNFRVATGLVFRFGGR